MSEPDTLLWRIQSLEESVRALHGEKANKETVDTLRTAVSELKEEVIGLRKVLIGTAASWLVGSTMFLLAVLELVR